MFPKCKFSREFLHPRYWLTWFGLGVLWLWVQLPYPVLCFLGTRIGTMARPFLKRRESIARKNLELCFPQHSAKEREKMIAENFRSLGMALVETGMAWFWPDSRVRKWFDAKSRRNGCRRPFYVAGTGRSGDGTLPTNDGHLSPA